MGPLLKPDLDGLFADDDLGREGQHAFLTAAAFGNIVFFQQHVVAMAGDSVEVQIE